MKYFISYTFMKEYKTGFGNCILDVENKIKCYEDIIELQEFISKEQKNDFTNILFYKEV